MPSGQNTTSRLNQELKSPPLHRVPSSSLSSSPSILSDIECDDDLLRGSVFDCLPLSPPLSPWKSQQRPLSTSEEDLLSFFPSSSSSSSFSALHTASSALFTSSLSSSLTSPSSSAANLSSRELSSPSSAPPQPSLSRQTSFLSLAPTAGVHPLQFTSVHAASHAPEPHHHRVSSSLLTRRSSSSGSHHKTVAPSDLFNTEINEILSKPSKDNEVPTARHQVLSHHQHLHHLTIDNDKSNNTLVSPDRLNADSRTDSSTSTIFTTSTSIISSSTSISSSMSSKSSADLNAAASATGHDHPIADNDATSATTSATTSASDENLRGATNDNVDVSATSATEIEIKQESLGLAAPPLSSSSTSSPPQSSSSTMSLSTTAPATAAASQQPAHPAIKQGDEEEVDELADEYKDATNVTATATISTTTTTIASPSSTANNFEQQQQPLLPLGVVSVSATETSVSLPVKPEEGQENQLAGETDTDGDITMKSEPTVHSTLTFDTAMQGDSAPTSAAPTTSATAATTTTTLPPLLPAPPAAMGGVPLIGGGTMPPIPMVGVPNSTVIPQDQLLSPSPSPQRFGSPSQQHQQLLQLQQPQQQEDKPASRASHSPPSLAMSLKPIAMDTKPRSRSFDATSLGTMAPVAAGAAAGPSSATGKAPRIRKAAPSNEKKPLKVYPPRKQRSRVNWDDTKVPPESPLSTLASAAVAVSTLSAATAITPASTLPMPPTVGVPNGPTGTTPTSGASSGATNAGVTTTASGGGGGSSGGGGGSSVVPGTTTNHAVPDDATLQALSKARAQLAAEGGGYRCELCPGERFGRVHDLKRHHISKHNEMTWPCDFCHRPFVRRDALLRHYTVKAARNDGVHPTTDEPERLSEARARAKLLS